MNGAIRRGGFAGGSDSGHGRSSTNDDLAKSVSRNRSGRGGRGGRYLPAVSSKLEISPSVGFELGLDVPLAGTAQSPSAILFSFFFFRLAILSLQSLLRSDFSSLTSRLRAVSQTGIGFHWKLE